MTTTTQVSTGVRHPIRYHLSADHSLQEMAQSIAETYLDNIIEDMVNHPRSLQKKIGPSEMGIDCSIRLIYKLGGKEEPPRDSYPWKPAVGTACHTWMEEIFSKASLPGEPEAGRWLVENKVIVGQVLGENHSGSTDLFDTWGNAVMDHKFIGKNTMKEYRAHGPSNVYRRQAQLYGKGWEDKGYKVDLVFICFLPREGELTDAFIWSDLYDRQVALDALDRVNKLAHLVRSLGMETAASLYQPCTDRWCPWCGTGSSWPRKEAANTTAELFAREI